MAGQFHVHNHPGELFFLKYEYTSDIIIIIISRGANNGS